MIVVVTCFVRDTGQYFMFLNMSLCVCVCVGTFTPLGFRVESLSTIAREEGAGSLWKGWLPTLLGYSAQVGIVAKCRRSVVLYCTKPAATMASLCRLRHAIRALKHAWIAPEWAFFCVTLWGHGAVGTSGELLSNRAVSFICACLTFGSARELDLRWQHTLRKAKGFCSQPHVGPITCFFYMGLVIDGVVIQGTP